MTETVAHSPSASLTADTDQFLTFTIEDEDYGIDILRVQEIKGISKVRPIPNTPKFVKGVVNLRGTVVPIIDLRSRFGMPEIDYNQFTVIIMVGIGSKVIGLVVDAVSDVLNINKDQVEPAPSISSEIDRKFFRGLGKVGEKLVLLLDIDRLVANQTEIDLAA